MTNSTKEQQALLNSQQEPLKKKKNQPAVPTRDVPLHAQCGRIQGALRIHGPAAGVKINTAEAVKGDGDRLQKGEAAYLQACAELRDLKAQLRDTNADAHRFIKDGRHVLTRELGPKENPAWPETGFTDNTLAISKRVEERAVLVQRMAAYFAEHRALEHTNLGVTSENGAKIHARLNQLLNEVDNQKAKERSLRTALQASRAALRKRIRGAIQELGMLLADDDQRWLAFDLTPPSVIKERSKQARAATLKAKAAAEAKPNLQVLEPVEEQTVPPAAAAA